MLLKTNSVALRTSFTTADRYLKVYSTTWKYLSQARKARGFSSELPKGIRHEIMTRWAREMLDIMQVRVIRSGAEPSRDPVLFVGNHIGYLDIPLLMSIVPVVFVAKKELGKWPLFGSAIKAVGTVLVSRNSVRSRAGAAEEIGRSILERKQSIALFPAGTTTLDESREWRRGAFQIAKQYGIPVQPFRIRFEPRRAVAFIENDSFLPHLWEMLKCPSVEAHIEFHEPVLIDDPEADVRRWWEWTRKTQKA